jgi:hypothetical protein
MRERCLEDSILSYLSLQEVQTQQERASGMVGPQPGLVAQGPLLTPCLPVIPHPSSASSQAPEGPLETYFLSSKCELKQAALPSWQLVKGCQLLVWTQR